MVAVWFNQPWLARQLTEGTALLLHGKLRQRNQFWVTEHELISGGSDAGVHTLGLVPVYPATQGITPERLRTLTWEAYDRIGDVVEPLPGHLRAAEGLAERPAALAAAHFPDQPEDPDDARRRLAFEELFLLELALAGRKRARAERARASALPGTGELVDPWLASLPFSPTDDQEKAFERIDRDIASETPMQRLLMGEVGSGKTVCALNAMLRAVENGRQAAFMAPTETLAEQHMATIDRLLGGHVPVGLLTGATPARRPEGPARPARVGRARADRRHARADRADRRVPRAGPRRRRRAAPLRRPPAGRPRREGEGGLGAARSAHDCHADPADARADRVRRPRRDDLARAPRRAGGRSRPHVVDGARARARAYERIREEIAKGRQCFVVCPLVEESEALQAKAATVEAERLAATEFRDQRVELIHGQMPTKRKQEAMAAFVAGDADVLVATSVIEVGIDVPNATVMLIEAAERYGISQLHQLRGRIGRGEHESLCILFGDPSLPRLEAIAKESDGFKLAEVDLRIRGAGEVLGTRQHGMPEFKVARLPEDVGLLERARERAGEALAADPRLEEPENALLREATVARFGSDMDPIPA